MISPYARAALVASGGISWQVHPATLLLDGSTAVTFELALQPRDVLQDTITWAFEDVKEDQPLVGKIKRMIRTKVPPITQRQWLLG